MTMGPRSLGLMTTSTYSRAGKHKDLPKRKISPKEDAIKIQKGALINKATTTFYCCPTQCCIFLQWKISGRNLIRSRKTDIECKLKAITYYRS